ncbi:hypothetical protein VPH35_134599 [Triticum aestivum]|uniref:Uncharacterized protein n=1 Tax=Aegilops tauschii TaxID=37682 RepID=R7WEI3_AEGTA
MWPWAVYTLKCVASQPFIPTTLHSFQFTSKTSHRSYWPEDYCSSSISGSAILTDDEDYYSNNFKVLVITEAIIEKDGTWEWHQSLYSFSSAGSGWSTPKKSFDDLIVDSSVVHSNIVACWGKVHRLACHLSGTCNLYTFDSSNDETSLMKLSIPLDQLGMSYEKPPWLNLTIDGKLSLVSLHSTFLQLEIWTHQGEEDSGESAVNWLRTKVIQLKLMMSHIKKVSCMCVSDRTRTLLIMDQLEFLCIVNLETGAVDDIMTHFSA